MEKSNKIAIAETINGFVGGTYKTKDDNTKAIIISKAKYTSEVTHKKYDILVGIVIHTRGGIDCSAWDYNGCCIDRTTSKWDLMELVKANGI